MIRTVFTLAVVATLSACASAPDTAKLSAPTANSGLSGDTPVGLVDLAAHKMAGTPADYDLRARAPARPAAAWATTRTPAAQASCAWLKARWSKAAATPSAC